jgi:hypothetical protein
MFSVVTHWRAAPKPMKQRKRVHTMYDFVALDLVRQRREQQDRAAERARLVREARPQKKRGHETQDR